jgi:hypothetical protein
VEDRDGFVTSYDFQVEPGSIQTRSSWEMSYWQGGAYVRGNILPLAIGARLAIVSLIAMPCLHGLLDEISRFSGRLRRLLG